MLSKKKLKVLQFCHSYGAPFADVARQYVALFDNTPHRVITVFLKGEYDQGVVDCVGGQVVFLGNSSKDIRGMKRKQIRQLSELCRQFSIDIIIAHRFKPLYIASHLKGIPIIGVHHAFGDYHRWHRRWQVSRHQKRIFLLGVSNAVRDDMRRHLPKFPEERIQTLYNRIDAEGAKKRLLSREQARDELGIAQDAFVIANVGRLHPDKDQATLLRAFARINTQIKNSLLIIVGEGKLQQQLQQQAIITGMDEQVIFPGKLLEACRYYRAFDCFVLSSDHEPFGMVLLEAMAAEVPIIASECGGAPEVTGETGWLFDLGDDRMLADRIKTVHALSAEQKESVKQAMASRLDEYFSDNAVYNDFWQLPFVQSMIK